MKYTVGLLLVAGLFATGCSKNEEMAEEPLQPEPQAVPAAAKVAKKPNTPPPRDLQPLFSQIRENIKAKRWDEVSVQLGALSHMALTPEQQRIARDLGAEAQSEMLAAMQSGSPEAQRAYQRYGVMVTGR